VSRDELSLLEAKLKRTLLNISLLVREHHTLRMWNLPARKFLFQIVEYTQQTKLQLFEEHVVNVELEKNLFDERAATEVATVYNFITVIVWPRASDFAVNWACSPCDLYQFGWTIEHLLSIHNNGSDGEVGELG